MENNDKQYDSRGSKPWGDRDGESRGRDRFSRERSYGRKPFNRDGEGRSRSYSNNSYKKYNNEGGNSEQEGTPRTFGEDRPRRFNAEGTEHRSFRKFDDKGGGREFKPHRNFGEGDRPHRRFEDRNNFSSFKKDNEGGQEGQSENREFRPHRRFDENREGRDFKPRRPFNSENGERRSFNRDGERRSFNRDGEHRSFNRDGERRPFNRDTDERRSFNSENGERSSFNSEYGERRSFHRDNGERRSFGRDDDRFGGRRDFRPSRFGDSKPRTKTYENPTDFVSIDKNLLNRNFDDEWSDNEVITDYEMPQEEEEEIKQPATEAEGYRINRFISGAGVCSRRAADDFIASGRITLNGNVVTDYSTKVFPGDEVCLDGKKLTSQKLVYIVFNKPKDCICTKSDELGRRTIFDYIKSDVEVKNVGRLDRDTTGVMLLTNDGDLIERLTHPRYNKMKIYHVFLNKNLSPEDLEAIRAGVDLDAVMSEDGTEQKGGHIDVDDLQYVDGEKNQVGIQIHSGLYHVVRRIFEKYGYTVEKLDRVYFSGLTKRDLPRGRWRYLSQKEVAILKRGAFA